MRALRYIILIIAAASLAYFHTTETKWDTTPKDQTIPHNETTPTPSVSVIRIIDGDTVVVRLHDTEQSVRLLGVDAAEIKYGTSGTPTYECYAREARDELERLLTEKEVRLEQDPLNENTDKYGRLLRYLFLSDGTLVNNTLIETGFTKHLFYFPTTRQDEFQQSEARAKAGTLGLWSVCE